MNNSGAITKRQKATAKSSEPIVGPQSEMYREHRIFQQKYSHLRRMINEGYKVDIDDAFRRRLLLSQEPNENADALSMIDDEEDGHRRANSQQEVDIETKVRQQLAFNPDLPMTENQRARYEMRKRAKPRPREIFDVLGMIQDKEDKIIQRRQLRQIQSMVDEERKLMELQTKLRDMQLESDGIQEEYEEERQGSVQKFKIKP